MDTQATDAPLKARWNDEDSPSTRAGAALAFLLLTLTTAMPPLLLGQGASPDNGHAAISGRTVFAAWNFEAGSGIPDDFSTYPEFLPFLGGWDFRINLPFVRYKLAASGLGSPAPMVGVVEGPAGLNTIAEYGHRNNSIWLFQVDADGNLRYKLLPSSRTLSGPSPSATRNVRSLTADWRLVGDPGIPGSRPPPFLLEPVAAAVVGEGLGLATVNVVARSAAGGLFFNQLLVDREDPSWTSPWVALQGSSDTPASLSAAFDGKLALAWVSAANGRVNTAIFTPSTRAWSTPVEVAPAGSAPQLLWDGTALNLLFVGSPTPVLRHTSAAAPSLSFQSPTSVSPLLSVRNGQFHAMVFNQRLHVAIRQDDGSAGATRVFYSKTTTQPGDPSHWSAPSETGLTTFRSPRIASLQNLIFVVATDAAGRIVYSTKAMMSPGNDLMNNHTSDRWISPGTELVSNGGGDYRHLEVLTFNDDVYLTAYAVPSDDVVPHSLWIVNLSRAAMKNLLTAKLGMRLSWGEPGGGPAEMGVGKFATFDVSTLYNTYWPLEGDIPLIGDFNGDGSDDIVRFTQKAESGVGPAPAYVSLSEPGFQAPTVWHPFFSLDGEIPSVGDFNGDGKDDIISFTQTRQFDASGTPIGEAPVWVSLSDSTRFLTSRVWHPFFSLRGEIPLVGDFNGDGKDDIVTFTQTRQFDAGGNLIGEAPVWVALSDSTRFLTSRVWHPFFSLRGEIPLVGDFNGDGKDDIITFTQQRQTDATGNVIGTAPVWVSLSDGTRFGPSSVWHTFFSPRGEIPRVADLNLDGKDIITFLHGQGDAGLERVSFVAFSTGNRFTRSSTWVSDFGAKETIPFIGHFSQATLATITGQPGDSVRRFPDLIAFRLDGSVNVSFALANYPMPSGAPWERYKWFTQKGVGASMFPEWIWEASRPCLASKHRLSLLGAGGTGGGDLTNLSARMGSRMGHVLEEVGHSIFANCIRSGADPFGVFADIFTTHWRDGGFGSAQIADTCVGNDGSDYYDCRMEDNRFGRSEHIFLHLMIQYLADPEVFRARIVSEPNPLYREHLSFAYGWLTAKWFEGLEFLTLPAAGAEMKQEGLHCGAGQCMGGKPRRVTHLDLTDASPGSPRAAGDPFGYVFDAQGVQNAVFRATDGHIHELWRSAADIGHSNLTALAGAPAAAGEPKAYVFAAHGLHNVVYRGTDGKLHGLYWSTGAVGHDNLTNLSHASRPAGDPFGYVFDAQGVQNVVYRGRDGKLHGVYWSTGAVGHDNLTNLSHAPRPAGDPFGYVFDAQGVQNVVYRGTDGHLHGVYWSTGAVGHDDLTALSQAPAPAGGVTAYVATTYGLHNVVYRGTDGHLHGLYWSTGAVGHDDLTSAANASAPVGDPAAWFDASDGTHHVIYRSGDGHLHELRWTTGAVNHYDLTALATAPPAAGDPSGYFVAADGTHHVIYRTGDGHLHELRWGK